MKKTGIFLTGGGGIGAFHIGFFKALEEHGIKFDTIVGSSVGALVGGAATYLTADEMYQKWFSITLENALHVDSNKIKDLQGKKRTLMLYKECLKACVKRDPKFLLDFQGIRDLLYTMLDGERIKKSPIEFGITTTLLPSLKMEKVFKEKMITNPLEYILTSLYMPVYTREKMIDGRSYVDLSRFRRYPLEMLKQRNCERVFVVNLEANHLWRLERPIKKFFNNGEEVTLIDYEHKPSILDFSHEQSEINYKNGYEATIKKLIKK